LALLLACALLWIVSPLIHTDTSKTESTVRTTRLSWPLSGYLDNYKTEPYLSSLLAGTLADGSSIVLFGSSELATEDHPAKPVNFFNKRLKQPLLAIGHDGNQCLAIHSQLITAGGDLSRAKLAILLSPSWFGGAPGRRGTELSCFLEYNPSPSLYRLVDRMANADTLVRPAQQYLVQHANDLAAAEPIVKYLVQSGSALNTAKYWFALPWTSNLKDHAQPVMMLEPKPLMAPDIHTGVAIDPPEWDSLYADAVKAHLSVCTNNEVFINDEFYSTYINGDTRLLRPLPVEENREFQDLIALLDYLVAMNADPVFIVQPVNPFVYTDLDAFDPTIQRIKDELRSRGFAYLDLWATDTAHFDPGVLTDAAHLGAYGWYRVDSMILAHFQ
jgi:D-alanine transfer protein